MKTSTTSTAQTADSKSLSNIRFITITALFIALTYVFTAFINIRLPITANGGLIHLGNVPLFICAIFLVRKVVRSPAESAWDSSICSPAGLHGLHSH